MKYFIYTRKSTKSKKRQVLSIDSQIKEILQLTEKEGLEVVTMKQESHSAKETGQKPIFNKIIEKIKLDKFNGMLTWTPKLYQQKCWRSQQNSRFNGFRRSFGN